MRNYQLSIINFQFILVFLMTVPLFAQDTLDSKRVDQKTLHHYYQGEWKPLIQLGKKAIEKGVDFKYLRYRMGVAQYELGHYNQALPQFKLVEKETLSDTLLQEYIYYSYLSAGRQHDARVYAEKMDQSVRKKVGFQKFRFVDEIYLNIGGKFSALPDSVGHMFVATLGMSHQLGTRLKYTHQFTYLTQNYLGLRYNQFAYYGKAEVALSKALQWIGVFHYVGTDGNFRSSTFILPGELRYDKHIIQTGFIGLTGFQGNAGDFRWKVYAGVSSWKTTTTVEGRIVTNFPPPPGMPPLPDTTYTTVSNTLAIQFGLELGYRISIDKQRWVDISGHFSMQNQNSMQNRRRMMTPIWGAKIYGQLTPKIGLELSFLQANTTYFLANDAAFVSNTIDRLNAQVALTFNYQVSPKVNWHFTYAYENRINDNFNFDYHIFSTGIKYKL